MHHFKSFNFYLKWHDALYTIVYCVNGAPCSPASNAHDTMHPLNLYGAPRHNGRQRMRIGHREFNFFKTFQIQD